MRRANSGGVRSMRRRELIGAAVAGSAALLATREAKAQERVEQAGRAMRSPIITASFDSAPIMSKAKRIISGLGLPM